MRRIVLYFVWLGILSGSIGVVSVASAELNQSKITVLSSIKPVQMIVVAIAGDHVNSDQLIPDTVSPHDYSFKPSDIRKIKSADLIFRIDEHFETMLEKVLDSTFDNLTNKSKVFSLAENPNIKLLPKTGGHQHEAEHGHADMHIFTSPENALFMAQEIAEELIKADAKNADFYQKNLQIFSKAITHEVALIKSKLEPVKDNLFIVFHHSWQYFETYFGLKKPKVINMHEGISSGVKSIISTRKAIAENQVHCVFSDPEISTRRVKTLMENLNIKTVEIDVMGRGLLVDENSYTDWLKTMGAQIKTCLDKD